MSLRAFRLATAISSAAMLLLAAPAWACGKGGCDCPHRAHARKGAADPNAAAKAEDGLQATCNCEGPSDCTCKKGQCKCKKCSKHQGATGAPSPAQAGSESA